MRRSSQVTSTPKKTPTGKLKTRKSAATKAVVKSRPVGTKKPVLMAGFDDDLLTKQDPDDAALAQNRAEWGEVVAEDPLEILADPTVALELSEDPVRLYLKEIGQIHLLDADSEFRLAARIEAKVRVDTLVNHAIPVRAA